MAESGSGIDKELIRELAKLLDETNLTEIEIEREGLRVRVGRGTTAVAAPVVNVTGPAAYYSQFSAKKNLPPSPSLILTVRLLIMISPSSKTKLLMNMPAAARLW